MVTVLLLLLCITVPTELVFVLHAINGQAEVFPSFKDGRMEPSVTPTRVPLMDIAKMTQEPDVENLQVGWECELMFSSVDGRATLSHIDTRRGIFLRIFQPHV